MVKNINKKQVEKCSGIIFLVLEVPMGPDAVMVVKHLPPSLPPLVPPISFMPLPTILQSDWFEVT